MGRSKGQPGGLDSQDLLSWKMIKSLDRLRNLKEKMQKSAHFSIKIETNCQEMPTFSDPDVFLETFRSGH